MPLGILRYTPSAFSSIQHLLADICSSLMKTPLITVISVDLLDYSGETTSPDSCKRNANPDVIFCQPPRPDISVISTSPIITFVSDVTSGIISDITQCIRTPGKRLRTSQTSSPPDLLQYCSMINSCCWTTTPLHASTLRDFLCLSPLAIYDMFQTPNIQSQTSSHSPAPDLRSLRSPLNSEITSSKELPHQLRTSLNWVLPHCSSSLWSSFSVKSPLGLLRRTWEHLPAHCIHLCSPSWHPLRTPDAPLLLAVIFIPSQIVPELSPSHFGAPVLCTPLSHSGANHAIGTSPPVPPCLLAWS
ncbi:hypothetical protein L210DRAFT_3651750 [Boletus edulis BED1]|uniref:Uncharacterized protein n=1 Tax=Boletus edulis BED1 TaxID=1328754 RepID=A0AAD4G914_BOLED|nr:hypothetical protein L210DRAFT_3651750 [Boletus edulis BED1]